MPTSLKGMAKALLPPIVVDASRPKAIDPWEHVTPDAGGYFAVPGGEPFFLRDTHADREVCRQVFLYEDYSLKRTRRLEPLMKFYEASTDPIIVDAGANIGAASRWFAAKFPRAKIVAVEPEAGNFALLSRNTCSYPSIVPVQAAIAAAEGSLVVTDPGGGSWAYRTSSASGAKGPSIAAMTIENVVERCGDGDPFILKIDIEGAEADLFSRHAELFDRFPLIIIELHDWMLPKEGSSRNFLGWHLAMSRDFVFSGENVFSISQALS